MRQRNIAVSILLSLVTCGIYSIYWFIVLTDDIRNESGEHFTSGAMSFFLTFITCGIYGFYWAYKMGQMLQAIKARRGMPGGSDLPVVYLILQIVQLSIVNMALMQNEINQMEKI